MNTCCPLPLGGHLLATERRRWHDGAIMNARTQIKLDPETQRRAQEKAAELGISFAEYVRRVLAQDLGPATRSATVSLIFDLVDEGPSTRVALDKDKMIADAVWSEHTRRSGPKSRTQVRARVSRR